MDQASDRISDAVETCLAFAVGNSDPFLRVSAYLKSLKDDGDWADGQIMEIQTRVIRGLMKRIKAGDAPSADRST